MEKENKELRELLTRALECLDKPKQPFKDEDVVNYIDDKTSILKITNIEKGECYGISNDKWGLFKGFNFNTHPYVWQLSTPEKWLEVCTKEAEKRGLVSGARYNPVSVIEDKGEKGIVGTYYSFNSNGFYNGYQYLMKDGIWATVLPSDKTLEELLKKYFSNPISLLDEMVDNKEAYIKALQNLKK